MIFMRLRLPVKAWVSKCRLRAETFQRKSVPSKLAACSSRF